MNKHVAFSGEYTRQIGLDTLREAALLTPGSNKAIDSVRFETYQRLNDHVFDGLAASPIGPIPSVTVPSGSGFAVSVDKKLGRVSGNAGFARVDDNYSVYGGYRFTHSVGFSMNGDSYGQGKHPFVRASVGLTPGVSLIGFYTHEVGSARYLTFNQQNYSAGISFDFKAIINHEKKVF